MDVNEEEQGGALVLRPSESRLDAARAPALREALLRRIEDGRTRIVLDLSGVSFMDSSGLGALVSALKRLGPGGTLAVAGATGAVARLFQLTRMDRVFALHPDVASAVAGAGGT